MKELEQFYKEKINPKMSNDVEFKDLHTESVKAMEKSVTFSVWKFVKACEKFKDAFKRQGNSEKF